MISSIEPESHHADRKSIRTITGTDAGFRDIAQDCVCFANGAGGTLYVGIEDGADAPPSSQRVDPSLLDKIRKRIGELTVNVQILPRCEHHENGGEYIVIAVHRSTGVASTSDGRYFLRIGDTCRPVVGDDVMRLIDERPETPWEAMTSNGVSVAELDPAKVARFCSDLRSSDRVKASVKEKSNDELLIHYNLTDCGTLTNLGVLLLGSPRHRIRLGSAPVVQVIKYDELDVKVAKWCWDDHELSIIDLLDAIWNEVPDFRESYELPDGMYRTKTPAYDELVVRELLVNAFVHRPYTQRGDFYLNLHPDRLEVVNPGRLPLGVTPRNILHASRRRNIGLARIFHDMKLMEREGSGIDMLFERLLATGRQKPQVTEGFDSVRVCIRRRVAQPGIIRLLAEVDSRFQLTQRERITLSLLAQSEATSASDLAGALELSDVESLRPWFGRLLAMGLVEQSGRTSATRYFVPPALLQDADLDMVTTLTRIPPHRLRALVLEDLARFPNAPRGEIWRRIGPEIPERNVKQVLDNLVASGHVVATGKTRARRFRLAPQTPDP